ncbi:polyprenyl synthetase family protein [uncultured Paludibaculum sp.]|uniref:polyprenyl synthetase family protein n=1 Tax=uncultured Paludibaculum sp. TaxID=1765020 RepID=UPI002AAA985E|nr:polyprenyl synthetase family protein [uncultured Paludibaculum sp.]
MATGKLGLALTTREILSLVSKDLEKVEQEFRLESVASVEAVSQIAQYLQGNGGKRLRPIMLLVSCRLFREPSPEAIRLAAVVELIHTATLVHDDIIDDAKTRRGKPSANVLWGNHTSVLAGDWLYMQAFQIALRMRSFEVLDLLITLTQQMVDGELLQLERIGRIDITEADSMELMDRKTATLFSACTKLGAIAAGASESEQTVLGDFGWNLGMAFQLVDDILDFTSRESILGKPVGNDLREGKVTLPLIYALQDASLADRAKVAIVLKEGNYEKVPFEEIRAILDRHHGVERARVRAHEFTAKARTLLQTFHESPARTALFAATDLVADRDR